MNYIERDCTFTHEGQTYESGGAVVTPGYAVGYMSEDMRSVTKWTGERLGCAKVKSSWPQRSNGLAPRFTSDRQYQVEARIMGADGIIRIYTGRTMGPGMLWRGKAKKGK